MNQKELDKRNRKIQDETTKEYISLLIRDLNHTQNCPVCMKRVQLIERCSSKEREKREKFAEIKSPIVGTFYTTPTTMNPDLSQPFVKVGDHVEPETVVCIVMAMMVPVEVKSETKGTIIKVLKKDGEAQLTMTKSFL